MPRITKVYTRGGDDGTTSLGGGERVRKDSPRIEACGAVDELSSEIGVAVACGLIPELTRTLQGIQNELFHLGADLCMPESAKQKTPVPQIGTRHIDALEALLDDLTAKLGPIENFVLPGGSGGAARIHVARAVCRRAERAVVSLADREPLNPLTIQYLNRLSDALFVMARFENLARGIPDVLWDSRA